MAHQTIEPSSVGSAPAECRHAPQAKPPTLPDVGLFRFKQFALEGDNHVGRCSGEGFGR